MLLSLGNYSLHTDPVAQMSYQIQELRASPLAFYRLLECDPVTRECVEENRSRLRYNRTLYESVVSQIRVYECLLEATKYGYGGEHCRWHAEQRDRLDPFRVKEFTPKGPDLRMVVTAYAERDLAEQEKFVESQQRQLEKAQESSAASRVVVTSWAEPGSLDAGGGVVSKDPGSGSMDRPGDSSDIPVWLVAVAGLAVAYFVFRRN